jgi:AraC-like DNA-binding protein
MCQALAGRDFHPLEVALAHAAPSDTGPWFEHFRCPVVFEAPVCRFVVSEEAAAAARTPVSAHLEQLHDRMMLDYLQNMEGGGLEEKVKAAIVELLPSGEVTDAKVAEQLFMTDRTLQRRLHQSGTTFKQLLTEVRNELAEHYLREGRYSLSEISYLLGFSELSAFSRAFKRWKGVPPSAWRAA